MSWTTFPAARTSSFFARADAYLPRQERGDALRRFGPVEGLGDASCGRLPRSARSAWSAAARSSAERRSRRVAWPEQPAGVAVADEPPVRGHVGRDDGRPERQREDERSGRAAVSPRDHGDVGGLVELANSFERDEAVDPDDPVVGCRCRGDGGARAPILCVSLRRRARCGRLVRCAKASSSVATSEFARSSPKQRKTTASSSIPSARRISSRGLPGG